VRESNHSPPSDAEVKNGGAVTSIPLCLAAWLIKLRENFVYVWSCVISCLVVCYTFTNVSKKLLPRSSRPNINPDKQQYTDFTRGFG
jgi:hypothetical protein